MDVYSHINLWAKNRKKQRSIVAKPEDFNSITPSQYKKIPLTYH